MREIRLVAAPPAGENPLLPSVLGASYANVSLVLIWSSQSPRSGLCQNPERPLQAGPPDRRAFGLQPRLRFPLDQLAVFLPPVL